MISRIFAHVETWVFDLDNTLYPPSARLFDQIETRMTDWVMTELGVDRAEADRLRSKYWAEYGTTLAGLMAVHGVEPDGYLHDVHEISLDHLEEDVSLAGRIAALPGRKIVYTNGAEPYARRVLAARGLGDVFEHVYGVEHADYLPKPQRVAFAAIFSQAGVDPTKAAMFEDDIRNLEAPFEMGMRTVHVAPEPEPADHIHHHTDDLEDFLSQVLVEPMDQR